MTTKRFFYFVGIVCLTINFLTFNTSLHAQTTATAINECDPNNPWICTAYFADPNLPDQLPSKEDVRVYNNGKPWTVTNVQDATRGLQMAIGVCTSDGLRNDNWVRVIPDQFLDSLAATKVLSDTDRVSLTHCANREDLKIRWDEGYTGYIGIDSPFRDLFNFSTSRFGTVSLEQVYDMADAMVASFGQPVPGCEQCAREIVLIVTSPVSTEQSIYKRAEALQKAAQNKHIKINILQLYGTNDVNLENSAKATGGTQIVLAAERLNQVSKIWALLNPDRKQVKISYDRGSITPSNVVLQIGQNVGIVDSMTFPAVTLPPIQIGEMNASGVRPLTLEFPTNYPSFANGIFTCYLGVNGFPAIQIEQGWGCSIPDSFLTVGGDLDARYTDNLDGNVVAVKKVAIPALPTSAPTPTTTNTPIATETSVPTNTPTNTSLPTETATDTPTQTSLPPTDTPTATSTDTPVPSMTLTDAISVTGQLGSAPPDQTPVPTLTQPPPTWLSRSLLFLSPTFAGVAAPYVRLIENLTLLQRLSILGGMLIAFVGVNSYRRTLKRRDQKRVEELKRSTSRPPAIIRDATVAEDTDDTAPFDIDVIRASLSLESKDDVKPTIMYLLDRGNVDGGNQWRIGRFSESKPACDPDCTIVDPNKRLSRLHITISEKNNRFFLRDEGAGSGTWVRTYRLQQREEVPLSHGDTIKMGVVVYRFALVDDMKQQSDTDEFQFRQKNSTIDDPEATDVVADPE